MPGAGTIPELDQSSLLQLDMSVQAAGWSRRVAALMRDFIFKHRRRVL